jgi:hypothetical protein
MPEQSIPSLIQEGETVVQQDPQGSWAIVQKPNGGGQVMRATTPTGIIEQPLAQDIPASVAGVPPAGLGASEMPGMPETPPMSAATGVGDMTKTVEYMVAGEVAAGVATAGAELLVNFFKNK